MWGLRQLPWWVWDGERRSKVRQEALLSPRGVFVAGLPFLLGLLLTFSVVSERVASHPHPQFLIPPILIHAKQPQGRLVLVLESPALL